MLGPCFPHPQPLSRLVALETLQIDKREEDDDYGGVTFDLSPRVVGELVAAWSALQTLDLYNITPHELPSEVRQKRALGLGTVGAKLWQVTSALGQVSGNQRVGQC